MTKGGYTYILCDRPFGILYTGVTSDLTARTEAHRLGLGSAFARKWNCSRLVLVEEHPTIK